MHHQKVLFNLTTLIDNCADKTLDHLDFNPRIKAGLEMLEFVEKINEGYGNQGEMINPENYQQMKSTFDSILEKAKKLQ